MSSVDDVIILYTRKTLGGLIYNTLSLVYIKFCLREKFGVLVHNINLLNFKIATEVIQLINSECTFSI